MKWCQLPNFINDIIMMLYTIKNITVSTWEMNKLRLEEIQ